MNNFKTARFITLLTLISMLVQSCVLYPPYTRPCVQIPNDWRINTDESSSYINFHWWEQFHDPILNNLIVEALEENNDLKVAIARVWEFWGLFLIAQSGLWPQAFANAQQFRQETSIALSPLPAGFARTTNNYFSFFNASYEVDIWGKIRSQTEAGLANYIGSIYARRGVVLTVVSNVANTYILLRQFDKQRQVSINTLRSREEAYEYMVNRYEGGLATELEVKRAEAEMESAKAQILRFEILIAQQEDFLSVLIGRAPQDILRGLALDQLYLPPDVPAGIPSQVLDQRPDIQLAEQTLIAANAEIGVAKAEFFPDIVLTANYGNASTHLHNLFKAPARTWQYGGTIIEPLFTGGRLIGQLDVAEAQKWEAYYGYRQTVLTAFQEVNDALIAHEKTQELLQVQHKRVEALQISLELAQLQYNNGQVDYLNVLDAERDLFIAQLDEVEAEGDIFISLVNIYKALGGGWVVEADCWAMEDLPSPPECISDF